MFRNRVSNNNVTLEMKKIVIGGYNNYAILKIGNRAQKKSWCNNTYFYGILKIFIHN